MSESSPTSADAAEQQPLSAVVLDLSIVSPTGQTLSLPTVPRFEAVAALKGALADVDGFAQHSNYRLEVRNDKTKGKANTGS